MPLVSNTDDLSRLKIARDVPSARSAAQASRRNTYIAAGIGALVLAVVAIVHGIVVFQAVILPFTEIITRMQGGAPGM